MMEPFTTDEQRLRLAVSLSGMGLLEIDYRENVATADPRAAEMFDLPAGVPVVRSAVHDRFHVEDRDQIERNVDALLRSDGVAQFTMDHRVVHGDGTVRWLNVRKQVWFTDGQPAKGLLAAIDITDRKTSEQQMQQSHETFRQVVEDNPFGVYVIDDVFKFRYVSKGAEQTFSNMMPLVGRNFSEVIHAMWPEPFASEAITQFKNTMQSGQPYTAPLLVEQRTDRHVVESYEWKIKRVSLPDNRKGVVCYFYDATERQQFEQSLREAKQLAEAASRSRGEFLANMSHEIRTPMAAILGHADILKDHLKDPDNVQLVETIRRNGNFLLTIINDILDLSKIDAGKMAIEKKPVRPDSVVGDVRSLMDVRASEKDLPLTITFDGPIPETIKTDAVRLRQILLNLVGNAIKFTDAGEVRLVVRYDQNTLYFDVIDTGFGIAADNLDLLFEPFKQVDNTSTRSFGGTGLGLAICRRLAKALGGDVGVESTPGKGSRFTFSLNVPNAGPLIQPNLNVSATADAPAENIKLAANVLVVDDRRDIRYLAQHFIEKAGGTVFTATNGQEAIDFIESTTNPKIDLIVMDMQMPVMDGYEAATQLRRRDCRLPIIALTANAMKSDREECLAAGCTDYTTKPLDHRKLINMIAKLI